MALVGVGAFEFESADVVEVFVSVFEIRSLVMVDFGVMLRLLAKVEEVTVVGGIWLFRIFHFGLLNIWGFFGFFILILTLWM